MANASGKSKPSKQLPKQKLLVSYVPVTDPSPEQASAVRRAIESVPGARVLGEFPGTIQIEASESDAVQLRNVVKSLDAWQIAEEGIARIPDTRGLPLGPKGPLRKRG